MMRIGLILFMTSRSLWAADVAPAAQTSTDSTSSQPKEPTLPKEAAGISPGERMLKMRDPFVIPEGAFPSLATPKGDLERFPIQDFKLLGVVTGPSRLRALVQSPEGKTYFVAEKMRIGIHNGTIRKITPLLVQVREKIVNVLGQEENVDSDIRLPPENVVGSADKGLAPKGNQPVASQTDATVAPIGR